MLMLRGFKCEFHRDVAIISSRISKSPSLEIKFKYFSYVSTVVDKKKAAGLCILWHNILSFGLVIRRQPQLLSAAVVQLLSYN